MPADPIAERLRVVEADWAELHRQNEQLIELNRMLEKRAEAMERELNEARAEVEDRRACLTQAEARVDAAERERDEARREHLVRDAGLKMAAVRERVARARIAALEAQINDIEVCPDCGHGAWVECEEHEGTHRKNRDCVGAVRTAPPQPAADPPSAPAPPGAEALAKSAVASSRDDLEDDAS